jgi:peptidoglycan/LPS O-acetylase OafA/YrhL
VIWTGSHNTYVNISFFTPTRIDTIAIGCLLAFYVRTDAAARVAERIKPRADAVLVGLAALLWAAFSVRSGEYDLLLLRAIEASLMSAIVFVAVISPNSAIGRVLNCRPFVAVGVLSYSLYLWQPLAHPATDRWPLGPWQNLVLLAVVAVASYVLVERPFLRLKDRLAQAQW